jgi:hypothetical protein
MIDNNNRSFFLNELDGFNSNTGLVVLATTNYPDRLDAAILNRPSRFDRKYYFNLPATPERLAYVAFWNERLQPALRLSERAASRVVQRTENFSFAYLKELFVSATTEWMSTNGDLLACQSTVSGTSMDEIILDQVAQLRGEISGQSQSSAEPVRSVSARVVKSLRRLFQKA